jgi:hypothetical protein
MAEQITPVKHINNKTAGVNPKDVMKSGKPVFMIRMFGIIQGVKNFEDRRSGDVKTVFIGDFRAVGPKGETYESDKLFLFKSLEEKLSSAFKSSGEKAQEFAYDITAIPDNKAATGYIYQAKGVIPTATNDALAALSKELGNTPLPVEASEAPKVDAAKGGKK